MEEKNFAAHLDCRYLLHTPPDTSNKPLIMIALHGYSSSPEAMLPLTHRLVGEGHVIAAIQGPNQHYVTNGLPDAQSGPGYNWGISQHWAASVRLHHDMVRQVFAELRERFEAGPERCVLIGFSQPVGLNYRFAATYPDQVAGVIGICGGVPRDWQEPKYRPVTAALLHISREDDEFYPPTVAATFPERLKQRATDVEFCMMQGAHRFPSKADKIVRPWLERVFGRLASVGQ